MRKKAQECEGNGKEKNNEEEEVNEEIDGWTG